MTILFTSRARHYGTLLCVSLMLTASPAVAEDTVSAKSAPLPEPLLLNAMPFKREGAAAPQENDVVYRSPDPVIKREVRHLPPPPSARVDNGAQQLAGLAPAAGPVMDPTPLIPSPTQTSQQPATVAATPPPAINVPPNEANYDAAALDALVRTLPDPNAPPAAAPPEAEGAPAIPVQQPPIAPVPALSDASKKVVDTIPSGIAPPTPMPKDIEINRAAPSQGAAGSVTAPQPDAPKEAETVAGNPAMGMSFQVKRSAVNLDYELEKAYNALINGQPDEATKIYKTVLENDGKNKLALFGLATVYHRAGQIELARPLYAKLLAIDPGNRDALNNFLVLLSDEAPQEALAQLEKLGDRNPGFSPIPAQMAVIYHRLGDTDKAIQKMFKATALAPENLTYQYNLAILLDLQKRYGEAAKLYRQLMQAHMRGEIIPGDPLKIQERLTFISSNRP